MLLMKFKETEKRWYKRHEGKLYAITVGKLKKLFPTLVRSETEAGSGKAANAWFVDQLSKDRTNHPEFRNYSEAIAKRQELIEVASSVGESTDQLQKEIDDLQKSIDSGDMPSLDKLGGIDPLKGISATGRAVWSERKKLASKLKEKPKHRSLADCLIKYLAVKEAAVKLAPHKAGNYSNVSYALHEFVEWLPTDNPKNIDGDTLTDFQLYLMSKSLSESTRRDRLVYVKAFIRWLYEFEAIDSLPRNFQSVKLTVSDDSMTDPFEDSEVTKLLKASDEKQKLWFLLMLNCGMTQEDISSLRHDEVDWTEGRIIRQRSKTGRRNRDRKAKKHKSIPEVNWKLWPETFRLLQANRSTDPVYVLLSDRGNRLTKRQLALETKAKTSRTDVIGRNYRRLRDDLGIKRPIKALRVTGGCKMEQHPEFARYAQHFLGQSPRSTAERFYVHPSQDRFDAAVAWLGEQFTF